MNDWVLGFSIILLSFLFFLLCYGFINVIFTIADYNRNKYIKNFYNQCPLYKQFLSEKQVFNDKIYTLERELADVKSQIDDKLKLLNYYIPTNTDTSHLSEYFLDISHNSFIPSLNFYTWDNVSEFNDSVWDSIIHCKELLKTINVWRAYYTELCEQLLNVSLKKRNFIIDNFSQVQNEILSLDKCFDKDKQNILNDLSQQYNKFSDMSEDSLKNKIFYDL